MKYIVVSGGVVSGLGKGVTSSSIGAILRAHGHVVTCIKIDPYLNVDAGTMSPFEHGECYVLEDGSETDLDLGNYERFLGITLTGASSITTGKVYKTVIENERRGMYLGKTVQIVPHITDEIARQIKQVSMLPVQAKTNESRSLPELCIIELGGTVGDIEGLPFIEALRIMRYTTNDDVFCFVHLSLVPTVGKEYKSKPTQHSIQRLMSLGIHPDILITRSDGMLDDGLLNKLSQLCSISGKNIIQNPRVESVYHVPQVFTDQGMYEKLVSILGLQAQPGYSLDMFNRATNILNSTKDKVRVALVGKYSGQDTYLSLVRAIEHGFFAVNNAVEIVWIDAETILPTSDITGILSGCSGVVIPGGFGKRGVQGMILAAKWARENDIPCLGICLGFQVQVIEWARSVGISGANSMEFVDTSDPENIPVVCLQEGQDVDNLGGTMRLGSQRIMLLEGTKAWDIYGNEQYISERHRHRYEVNPEYRPRLECNGFRFSGVSVMNPELMEILEYGKNRFYMGCQFHPELKTNLQDCGPLFLAFAKACKKVHKLSGFFG